MYRSSYRELKNRDASMHRCIGPALILLESVIVNLCDNQVFIKKHYLQEKRRNYDSKLIEAHQAEAAMVCKTFHYPSSIIID